jgi:hypothetical protein
MSFEVTVTPTVYDVEVAVNPSVQPFDVEVTVGNVPDLDLTTNGDSGASTFDPLTGELNIPNYTLDGLGGVPESRTITINGTTQDLSANRTFTIPAPDPVTIGSPANGLAIDGNQVLTIGLASVSQAGALSSTDWSTFNNKQNAIGYTPENVANKAINFTSPDDTKYPTTLAVSTALAGKQDLLTNPITGTGVAGQVSFWTGTGTQSGDNGLVWDNVNKTIEIKDSLNTGLRISASLLVSGTAFTEFRNIGQNRPIVFRVGGNNTFSIFTSGNSGFNTTTDAGYRLDVNGTARVQGQTTLRGAGNTSATTALLIQNSASSAIGTFRDDRSITLTSGTGTLNINTAGAGDGIIDFDINSSATQTVFLQLTRGTLGFGTSSTQTGVQIAGGFAPTSGTGVWNTLRLNPTINQTGGASNATRGLLISPTLSSAADWRSIEWSNNTGRGLWGAGTANNAMAGALNVGSATNANASAILELTSTTRGLLPPRMTGAQAEAISSPAEGLLVYSTDGTGTTITSKGWWGFDGSTWAQLN